MGIRAGVSRTCRPRWRWGAAGRRRWRRRPRPPTGRARRAAPGPGGRRSTSAVGHRRPPSRGRDLGEYGGGQRGQRGQLQLLDASSTRSDHVHEAARTAPTPPPGSRWWDGSHFAAPKSSLDTACRHRPKAGRPSRHHRWDDCGVSARHPALLEPSRSRGITPLALAVPELVVTSHWRLVCSVNGMGNSRSPGYRARQRERERQRREQEFRRDQRAEQTPATRAARAPDAGGPAANDGPRRERVGGAVDRSPR